MSKGSRRSVTRSVQSNYDLIDADPDFYRGCDTFHFPNGDRYEGEYIAHRKGLVWREGQGTYYTQDAQVYKGTWYNDKLNKEKEVEITFPDGTRYIGCIDNSKYVGPALYSINKGLHILAEFSENKPVGDIALIDMKGREWNGVAGENSALLLPEHTFFNNIAPRLGKGKLKIHTAPKIPKAKRKANVNNLEAKIFAKSKKTMADLKFEDSVWYQNYLKFRNVYDEIKEKITTLGEDGLCQEERDWMQKFREFKDHHNAIMNSKSQAKMKNLKDYKLFELYNNEEYMQAHNPVPVFYPSVIQEEEQEETEEYEEEHKESVEHGVKFGVTNKKSV